MIKLLRTKIEQTFALQNAHMVGNHWNGLKFNIWIEITATFLKGNYYAEAIVLM